MDFVQNLVWPRAIQSAADPPRARYFFEHLKTATAAVFVKQASADQARILVAVFSGSQALSELLVAHPEWLQACLGAEHLQHARQKQGLERDVQRLLRPRLASRDYSGAITAVREFKQREMLRIAARDLARLASTS